MKRVVSFLLTICVVVSLFACMSVNAFAAADVSADKTTGYLISYTIASGDTVAKVCKDKGIDFDANKNLISRVNNITNYNNIKVGKVLWLPVSDVGTETNYYALKSHVLVSGDTLNELFKAYGVNYGSVTALTEAVNVNGINMKVGNTVILPILNGSKASEDKKEEKKDISDEKYPDISADTVSGYLIKYTVKSGDTFAKICTNNGLSYEKDGAAVKAINGVKNVNSLTVGTVLWIPAEKLGTATEYYTLRNHVLASGDTLAAICTEYGMKYADVSTMITALNPNLSMTTGKSVVIPVKNDAVAVKRDTYQLVHKYVFANKTTEFVSDTKKITVKSGTTFTAADVAGYLVTEYKEKTFKYAACYTQTVKGEKQLKIEYKELTDADYITYTLKHQYVFADTTKGAPTFTSGSVKLLKDAEVKYEDIESKLSLTHAGLDFVYSSFEVAEDNVILIVYKEKVKTTTGDTVSEYLIPYTLKAGDGVAKVCKKLGTDFDKRKDFITAVNCVKNYSTLSVGTVLWLPVKDKGTNASYYTLYNHVVATGDTYNMICEEYSIEFSKNSGLISALNGGTGLTVGKTIIVPVATNVTTAPKANSNSASTGSTNTGTNTNTGASTNTNTGNTGSGSTATGNTSTESVVYYLVNYTLQSGDTVYTVCSTLGIKYNAETIKKLNGLSDINKVKVGQTLILPAASAPSSGSYYKVIAYTVKSGDTMSKICNAYGVSYKSALVQGLNSNVNFAKINVGQVIYIPVVATANA